jgi:hypothetical protein
MTARFMFSAMFSGVVAASSTVACGNDFDPSSKVASVRILATRADKPYARPGDTVLLELLALDGRAEQSRPMALSWLPAPCINPPGGSYYNCYPGFAIAYTPGVDLTASLVSGPTASYDIPAGAIDESSTLQTGVPFANVFVFSMACAGHVQYTGQRTNSPLAVPFACFDDAGNELGANDFVFGFARIFVFTDRTNQNPEIDGLIFAGEPVDPAVGVTIDHCPNVNDTDSSCPTTPINVVVPASSQEPDPSFVDASGNVRSEGIWVDYYLTGGKVENDLQFLYDATTGRVPDSDNALSGPEVAGEHTLWAVVHDSRGGVNWISTTIVAR